MLVEAESVVRKPEDQKISQVLAEMRRQLAVKLCDQTRIYGAHSETKLPCGWLRWTPNSFWSQTKALEKLICRWLRGSTELLQIILIGTRLYIIHSHLSHKNIHLKSHMSTSSRCYGKCQGVSKVSKFHPLGTLKPTKLQGNSF